MRSRITLSILGVVVCAALAAFWLLDEAPSPLPAAASAPAAGESAGGESATPPDGREESPAGGAVAATPRARGRVPAPPTDPRAAGAFRRPTLGLGLAARSGKQLLAPIPARELAPLEMKSQEAWRKHLAPLLYPPGHPDQGRWRDSVSIDQAVDAQVAYYKEILPVEPGYFDKPLLHVIKRVDYVALNERLESWHQHDIASSRSLYEWILAQPEDPDEFPTNLWLPADPGDPEATTRAEDMARRIRETERPNFAPPGG